MAGKDRAAESGIEGIFFMNEALLQRLLPGVASLVFFSLFLLPEVKCVGAYSTNFTVEHLAPGLTRVMVKNPWKGAKHDFCYLLSDRSCHHGIEAGAYGECTLVEVPVKRMVVLSSTYYAFIASLGATERMVGASQPQRSNTGSVAKGFRLGRIKDVGQGPNVNVETILELRPDVIFAYATGGFRDIHPKLEEAGLKVVLCAEYMEEHPLGRAEWIKFFGLFLGKTKEACKIFQGVEKRYLDLVERVKLSGDLHPSVIANVPFAGRWFVPGGRSFIARFIEDAGGDFIFKDTDTAGSVPMDVELVFDKGKEADFWINTGTWTSLSDIRKTDPRLLLFNAVRKRHVYNNNRRLSPLGTNDYWESGVLRPDRVLADLLSIFHPGFKKGYGLYYYRHLE